MSTGLIFAICLGIVALCLLGYALIARIDGAVRITDDPEHPLRHPMDRRDYQERQ